MAKNSDVGELTPEAELGAYLDRLDPAVRTLARAARTALRKRFPTARELAYDYSTFVVISYSPTERGIDAVVALAARPSGVFLHFNQGPHLPDPAGILQGKAKQMRFIPLASAKRLADPEVAALLAAAEAHAPIPLAATGKGCLTVKSGAAKKRAKAAAAA